METIPIEHCWKVWSLDRSQKSQVLQKTDKQDSISSYKTIISFYDTFQGK